MTTNWVLRRAQRAFVCDNCGGWVHIQAAYFLTQTGEKLCCECPPDDEAEEVRACQ